MIVGTIIALIIGWIVVNAHNNTRHMHQGCIKAFGIWNRNHVQEPGYYSDWPGYGKLRASGIDGTGRKHGVVDVRCDRCNKKFPLVCLHEHPEKDR